MQLYLNLKSFSVLGLNKQHQLRLVGFPLLYIYGHKHHKDQSYHL